MSSRVSRKLAYVRAMTRAHRALGSGALRTCCFFGLPRARFRVPFTLAGQRFLARPIDATAVVEVVLNDEYAVVADLLAGRPDPLVVDLGANVGLFALRVFAVRPAARVVCLEAAPDTAAVLHANARLHPARRWRVVHAAAWHEDGAVSTSRERASTARHVDANAAGAVPAVGPATLFDGLVAGEPVDLLKLDIEGAEEVFLAAAAGYLERVRAAIVEVHPERADPRRVRRLLEVRFDHVRPLARGSSKPLLVATRREAPRAAGAGGRR